jgi:hypothetical protein
MHRLETIPLERFLGLSADDLRGILSDFGDPRRRQDGPLDEGRIESLIRVMDRGGYRSVSALGPEAAKAWATRIGISD